MQAMLSAVGLCHAISAVFCFCNLFLQVDFFQSIDVVMPVTLRVIEKALLTF